MRKVWGLLTCLFLLSTAGSVLQGRDRHRDRRDLKRNVQVVVTTPYGGGYFVRGNPYVPRYVVPLRGPYADKHYRKRYYKELRRSRRGFIRHDHHHGHCRHHH